MPACKVCGRWFAKIRDDEELCDKCGVALIRLSGYAVPVVRCEDCKFNSGAKKCLNPNSLIAVPADDDFCSYGEKRA